MPINNPAKPSFGIRLQVADSSGANFVDIAEVRDVNWSMNAQIEETTAHRPGYPYRTRVATLLSFGPVEVMVNWLPTDPTHNKTTGLKFIWLNREERVYRMIDADLEEQDEFNALISDIKRTGTVAGVKTGSVTFQGTGAPIFT